MSTITVVRKNGVAAIAADSLTKWGSTKEAADYIVNHQKIVAVQDGYIAVAGATSAKLVLKDYFLNLRDEAHLNGVDAIFSVWLMLHETLKERYYLNPEEDENDTVESSRMDVLIANSSGIFGVSAHRAVQEFSRFYAYGRGNEYAMGAMYAVYDNPELSAEDIARAGVRAAAEFDDSTGIPVLSHSVEIR